jgi:hypothetical protein
MDIRNLSYPGGLFDLIIDKSTIDALLCGDNAYMNVAKMLKVIRYFSTYNEILGMLKSFENWRSVYGNFLWNS